MRRNEVGSHKQNNIIALTAKNAFAMAMSSKPFNMTASFPTEGAAGAAKACSEESEQCTCCGGAKKMMEHVLIGCGDIHQGICVGTSPHEASMLETTLES